MPAFAEDFPPLTDMRASRRLPRCWSAQNLLRRFYPRDQRRPGAAAGRRGSGGVATMNKHAPPTSKPSDRGGVHSRRSAMTAPQACRRRGGLYRRHAGAGGHAARLPRAWRPARMADHRRIDLDGGARGARRRRRADRRRHAGRQRRQPDRPARRAGACRRQGRVPRPADLRGRRRDARRRRGAPPAGQGRVPGPAARSSTSTAAIRSSGTAGHAAAEARSAATPRPAIADGAAPAEGPDARSAARSISTSKARSRLAVPGEDDDVTVYSSTQHPSEVQHMVAHVLGVPSHAVTVEDAAHGRRLRRQGDAGQPVRRAGRDCRQEARPRGQDPARPRRRHDRDRQAPRFPASTTRSASTTTAASSASTSPMRRAAAFRRTCPARSPTARCSTATTPISIRRCGAVSQPLKTNTVSNTAFRGFGGPQGMVGAERMIEEIAYALGKDPLEIRKRNFYGTDGPQRHALPPDGRGQHHRPHRRRARAPARTTSAPAARDRRVQRQQPRSSSRASR